MCIRDRSRCTGTAGFRRRRASVSSSNCITSSADFSRAVSYTHLKDSGLDTIESLNGRRVGATKGSSSEREIKRILDKSQVIGYGDSSATYLALQQKKVDAQFASELVLVRLVLQSPPTAPVSVIAKSVFDEPWGLGVRKSEPGMLTVVNQALDEACLLYTSRCV